MFNFDHSCLTKNFVKLGRVLSCVMAFMIIFFLNCNRILTDGADNTLVIWDNKIFRAPFTFENYSFSIKFFFLGCRHFILPEIITKNNNLLLQN